MKKIMKKPVLMISMLLLAGVMILFIVQSTNVFAQREYTPSVTNVGTQSASNESQFKINKNGERYGSAKYVDIGMLDLVLARGTNGKVGYVRAIDLEEPMPRSPEEAANWKTEDRAINLYEEDGTTVIGEFIISGNGDAVIYD